MDDIKDAPLTQPTPNGGNHPLWVLGHLTHSESNLLDVFIQGKENRFPELAEAFGMTSKPSTNADDYPAFDELMGKFQQIRAANLEYLAGLSDEDLDKASNAPEDFGGMFGTVGLAYAAMINHFMFHCGQVADARRAAGRDVLMA